jgi:hypothetical protein
LTRHSPPTISRPSGWATVPILNTGNAAASSTAYSISIISQDLLTGAVLSVLYPAAPTSPLTVRALATGSGTINATVSNDGQPHHYAMTTRGTAGTQTLTLYIDGVSQGTTTYASGLLAGVTLLRPVSTASTDTSYQNLPVVWGPLSLYWGGTYTSTLPAGMYGAGTGFTGDVTSARLARILGYAGLTSSDWNLDTGIAVMGAQPVAGQDVITICQACSATEGGGAAFYFGTDGKAQFRSRNYRRPGSPTVTVDQAADLDGSGFQPVYDDTLVVNQAQGTRADSGVTQVANDAPSQATYGVTATSFTSYASTDADVLRNAQEQVGRQRKPLYQVGQVPVDLTTATTSGLYASCAFGLDWQQGPYQQPSRHCRPLQPGRPHRRGLGRHVQHEQLPRRVRHQPGRRPAVVHLGRRHVRAVPTDGQTLNARHHRVRHLPGHRHLCG